MKIIRPTKCTVKFSSGKKKKQFYVVLTEYSKAVNIFINHFWNNPQDANKSKLLRPIVNLPETWLSAREAVDMISASKKRWHDKAVMPMHKGNKMYVSCTIADLIPSKQAHEFDAWLHLVSRQRIDEIVKELFINENPDLIVVEQYGKVRFPLQTGCHA